MDIVLAIWSGLTAFAAAAVGTKVVSPNFLNAVITAIKGHDASKDRAPGQHFIVMPETAFHMVSSGVGPSSSDPSHYVLREWRGEVQAFLKREFAEPVTWLAAIVYTKAAYLADPDCTPDDPIHTTDCTHVLIAVLAGSSSPLQPGRFVYNLAGGNNAEKPLLEQQGLADKIGNMFPSWDSLHSTARMPSGTVLVGTEEGEKIYEDYLAKTQHLAELVRETNVRGRAQEITEYWSKHSVVAD